MLLLRVNRLRGGGVGETGQVAFRLFALEGPDEADISLMGVRGEVDPSNFFAVGVGVEYWRRGLITDLGILLDRLKRSRRGISGESFVVTVFWKGSNA